jgi:undecaprenyl-diphosphatase
MNDTIFFFFYNLAHQSHLFDQVVVFFAVYFPYLVVFLAGIFLLFHHEVLFSENPLKAFVQKWKEILVVFFSGALAWFLAYILKYLFHTGRPFDIFPNVISLFPETGYAFPSGHATFFMALAFAIFFSHKKVGYIFVLFALLIGIARIIAGVHFPIDILGGFILGFLIAFLLKKV